MNPDKLFNSRYPIMVAAMNKASDLSLAIASNKAGIFPSLSGFNYYPGSELKIDFFKNDLESFNDATGSNNLIVSVELEDIFRDEFIEKICSNKLFSHIEVVDEKRFLSSAQNENDFDKLEKFRIYMHQLKSYGINPLFKLLAPGHWIDKIDAIKKEFPGAILKSADASGSVVPDNRYPLEKEFAYLKKEFPDKVFVPTGGISTKEQVKGFLDLGAEIVGVGAFFMTAEESPVSLDVKKKLIESRSADITKFSNSNHNALIFSKVENDDMNHTTSLKKGIIDPNVGHIYMSRSIDNIKEIKPLKDLVAELVED